MMLAGKRVRSCAVSDPRSFRFQRVSFPLWLGSLKWSAGYIIAEIDACRERGTTLRSLWSEVLQIAASKLPIMAWSFENAMKTYHIDEWCLQEGGYDPVQSLIWDLWISAGIYPAGHDLSFEVRTEHFWAHCEVKGHIIADIDACK